MFDCGKKSYQTSFDIYVMDQKAYEYIAIEFSSNVKQIFAIKYMCNPILSDYLTAHDVDYVLLFNGLFFKNLNNKPEQVISDCMFLLDDYKYLQTVNVGQAYFDFYERK